jgi:hypothetical protein
MSFRDSQCFEYHDMDIPQPSAPASPTFPDIKKKSDVLLTIDGEKQQPYDRPEYLPGSRMQMSIQQQNKGYNQLPIHQDMSKYGYGALTCCSHDGDEGNKRPHYRPMKMGHMGSDDDSGDTKRTVAVDTQIITSFATPMAVDTRGRRQARDNEFH